MFHKAFAPEGRFQTRFTIETEFNVGGMREGIDEIIDTFKMLGERFENIFTSCPIESARYNAQGQLHSTWIVGMSDRENLFVRIAAGTYLWTFTPQTGHVQQLDVLMEHMLLLPQETRIPIMQWLSPLPQPWCSSAALLETMPALQELLPLRNYFTQPAH